MATVTGLGKNRGDQTIVHLCSETGGRSCSGGSHTSTAPISQGQVLKVLPVRVISESRSLFLLFQYPASVVSRKFLPNRASHFELEGEESHGRYRLRAVMRLLPIAANHAAKECRARSFDTASRPFGRLRMTWMCVDLLMGHHTSLVHCGRSESESCSNQCSCGRGQLPGQAEHSGVGEHEIWVKAVSSA